METLYGLKRKTTNRWLKLLLLLFVAVGFGVPNLNAQTKSIKVADDKQLIEAINNPSVGSIILEAGYYPTLKTYVESGTKVAKRIHDGGNRDQQCEYWIIGANTCFNPTPPETFVENIAVAGYTDTYSCGCCPGPDMGSWSVTSKPGGSTVIFVDPLNTEFMTFKVDMPGNYILRYTWGVPYNSLVETEYYFYGPALVELSAPDVCGLSTTVNFELGSVYADPITEVEWTLDGLPYDGPDVTSEFTLTVAECGVHELSVTVTPSKCPPVTKTIVIDFACQPIADAGPDVNVCDETCYYSLVGSYGGVLLSPTHAWSWVELSSPPGVDLVFDDNTALVTGVCAVDMEDDCPYGEFAVEFQVQNGKCYDSDTMLLRFYEQPVAVAGPDQYLCNTFSFSLAAVPFEYCGEEGVNYWSEHHWELVSQVGDGEIVTIVDPTLPNASVVIDIADATCAYGAYQFKWIENNSKGEGLGGCTAEDNVVVNIFEDPMMTAGPDMQFCNTFAFTLFGAADAPCNDFSVVVYSWEKSAEPGNCAVTFNDADDLQPWVVIDQCDTACPYGEYIFALTQSTGYINDLGEFVEVCSKTDSVNVTIFEQPEANAGPDVAECVDIAFSPYCYTLYGTMDYCYTMHGIWTKSCGPGEVVLEDIYSPTTQVCIPAPGRYEFVWTLSNAMCEDADTVVFDLVEQPTALARDTDLLDECDLLCIDLSLAGVVKYDYFGTDQGECPNYQDLGHWSLVSGPAEVTFADDTDPGTELCVSTFGCYTVRWNEVNKLDDQICSDYVDVFVQFVETPDAFAGDDATICGSCYTMMAVPSVPANTNCPPTELVSYWSFIGYQPPDTVCDYIYPYYSCFEEFDIYDPNAEICLCQDDYLGLNYGTYTFVWTEMNGPCTDRDTVNITFNKIPDELPLSGCIYTDNCTNYFNIPVGRDMGNCGCVNCWYPGEDNVFTVCANTCGNFGIDWNCIQGGPIPGYTYEWSFIGPAGSSFDAAPFYYDCECGWKGSPMVYLCFGECCDTARLYLTITSPEGCVTTEEWKFYVQHPPDATISGPEVAEIGQVFEYSVPNPENSCYLYTWDVQHCGIIVSGQGTGTIGVQWTDYNENGGWGLISVAVYDTCTCCCNTDEFMVKVYPQNTLGDAMLSGHVYYHNYWNTPLDGVEIQLWNGGIPVQTTTSFNDIEGGNGVGYFEFPGINGVTEFGITASYDAPWYGANATDALAVQLEVISALPGGFLFDNVVAEAMDVNNSSTISATDALWIKQRAINMVNYFPAGDWVFAADSSMAGTHDIYTLNAGDANRSNIPNSMKSAPAIDLITDGTMNVATGEVFSLPIRIANASQFGAITLNLGYNPSILEVVDVNPIEGMLYNITDGSINIAWSSVNPMILTDNEVVVTLKVKAISPITSTESLFSIGMNSEFADANATVIEPVTLKTYGVTTGPAATDYFLSANRPNPFSTSTFIEYTMPESGKVKLSVLDMLGQEMAVLVDATQSAGSYTVEFSAAGLSTGVYIYKISVDGETRDFISTQRMVISH